MSLMRAQSRRSTLVGSGELFGSLSNDMPVDDLAGCIDQDRRGLLEPCDASGNPLNLILLRSPYPFILDRA